MKEMTTMLRLEHPDTNSVSTQDWLRASKDIDMTISAYEPRTMSVNPASSTAAPEARRSPFLAAHPSVAGKRNSVRASDDESITLGPARQVRSRQHANSSTLLHSKKHR
jgi:hypothetical protein